MNTKKWDNRFLVLAKLIGSWSKDPSTKVGAVIVDGKKNSISWLQWFSKRCGRF